MQIIKYKFGNRHFWSEGYYVSTVGLNEATIKKYIQDQEKCNSDLNEEKVQGALRLFPYIGIGYTKCQLSWKVDNAENTGGE